MKFVTETDPKLAMEFDAIGGAGFAADAWFNSHSRGEPYAVEILPRGAKWVVKIKDAIGFTVGHLRKA